MEMLATGKALIIADWFMGKELALAANVNMAISRQFYTLNGLVSPPIEQGFGLLWALGLGLVFCLTSVFSVRYINKMQSNHVAHGPQDDNGPVLTKRVPTIAWHLGAL